MPIIDTDGEIYTGTDLADRLYVLANSATVRGVGGDDQITTALRGSLIEALSTSLSGGTGHDTIQAALSSDYDSGDTSAVTATINGGVGKDEIGILASSNYGGGQSLTASGGAGADIITIESGYLPDNDPYHTVDVNVDGGRESDVINVSVDGAASGRTVIDGGSSNDAISAQGLDNEIYGGSGHDEITVTASETAEWSNNAQNYVEAGAGSDVIEMTTWGSYNTGHGGDGDDAMTLFVRGWQGANVAYGDAGNDTLDLTANGTYFGERAMASNEAYGGDGNDVISAAIILNTTSTEDWSLAPHSGLNTLYGGEGNDRITASIRVDDTSELEFAYSSLYGGTGNDRLKVSGGTENFLTGNQGNDTLLGSTGDDRMIGGQGDDYLKGYAGDDTFEFQSARNGERDRIDGFDLGGDVIDISRIDANAFRGGNQAFDFDGTGDGGTGRVWLEDYGTKTVLHADTGKAVLDIVLLDGADVYAGSYTANDLLL